MQKVPKELPLMQTAPDRNITFLTTYVPDTGLVGNNRFLTPGSCPSKWASRLRRTDMKVVLAVEAAAVGVLV